MCSQNTTDQYRMDASSPCKSVPAATVMPLGDTSQDSMPRFFPFAKAVTVQRHALLSLEFSGQLNKETNTKYSHCRPVVPDLSSHTLIVPSLPDDTSISRELPATADTRRRLVTASSWPASCAATLRFDLSKRCMPLVGADEDAA